MKAAQPTLGFSPLFLLIFGYILKGKAQGICYFLLTFSALAGTILFRNEFLAAPIPYYFFMLACASLGTALSFTLRKSWNLSVK